MEYKISGLNWLCVRDTDGNWIPAFKLTQDQISALKEAVREVEQKKGLYLNEALITHTDGLNNFTRTLKDRCEPTCGVVLRNGKRVEVAYSHHQQSFHTTDWNYSWRLDGSSLKNSDLDIVSM